MFSLGLINRIGCHDIGSDGSAIAEAVARATDPLLIGADWSKNLEICDMVDSTPEGQVSLVKMLRRQLRSGDEKTVRIQLTKVFLCGSIQYES